MQDPAIQCATASEPLSIEEEYDMQSAQVYEPSPCIWCVYTDTAAVASTLMTGTWHVDEDKRKLSHLL